MSLSGFYGTYIFVPVIDGMFIVERPTVTLEKGQVNGVSIVMILAYHTRAHVYNNQHILLSVTNTDEGYIFVNTANPPTNLSNYVTELFPLIDSVTVQAILQQYENVSTYPDVLSQAIAVMGECQFHFVCILFVQAY